MTSYRIDLGAGSFNIFSFSTPQEAWQELLRGLGIPYDKYLEARNNNPNTNIFPCTGKAWDDTPINNILLCPSCGFAQIGPVNITRKPEIRRVVKVDDYINCV